MKIKKIISLAFITTLLFSLCSCTAVKSEEGITTTTSTTQAVSIENTENDEAVTEASKKDNKKSTTTTTEKTASTSTNAKAEKSTSKQKKVKITTTKKIADTSEATESTAEYCTITIECKSVLDNMQRLKAGHSSYVPDTGYILKDYKCEYAEGCTAYDILKQGCSDNGIKLTSSKTAYGTYVSGINNLDEFDCGGESGWLYMVNGKKPPISCDKFTVAAGDEIVFYYTCKY